MAHELPSEITNGIDASLEKLDGEGRRSSLSEQISKELADHLQCAAQREELVEALTSQTKVDEPQLWKQVLERFGDPARVAWQLWWDANWEKLMSQRITLGLLVAVSLLCGGLGYATWQSLALSRDAMQQAQRAAEQSATRHAEMMTRLTAMTQQSEANSLRVAPAEWNKSQIELRYDSPMGRPVEGATVTMVGISPNTRSIPRQELTTGKDGIADCGTVLFGEYAIEVKLADGTTSVRKIGVRPGQASHEIIVCPSASTRPVQITLEDIALPPELAIPEEIRKRVWYGVSLHKQSHPTMEDLIAPDQDASEQAKKLRTPSSITWEASLPHEYGLSLFLRPDGAWVQASLEPVQQVDVIDEDIRFLNTTAFFGEDRSSHLWQTMGEKTAFAKGLPVEIPLGDFLIFELDVYLEVTGNDRQPYLVEISTRVAQIHPQGQMPVPDIMEKYEREDMGEFYANELRNFGVNSRKTNRSQMLMVDGTTDKLTRTPNLDALLSLSARCHLPAGQALAQVSILMANSGTILAPGDKVDFVTFPKLETLPNVSAEEKSPSKHIHIQQATLIAQYQSSTQEKRVQGIVMPLQILLVGMTPPQIEHLASHRTLAPSAILFAEPSFKTEPAASPEPPKSDPATP